MSDASSSLEIVGRALTRADVEELSRPAVPLHFVDCAVEEVDLSGLDLAGCVFERCRMRSVKLGTAKLDGSRWISCRGAFADFSGSDLADATFRSCDFNNASFRRSSLSSAAFVHCKLTGSDLSEARALGATFEETLLIAAKLPSLSFRKTVLNRLDFSQADLRKADFRGATFLDCSLRDANLVDARFENADLRGADIGGLRLLDARAFRGATISRPQAEQLLAEFGLRVL